MEADVFALECILGLVATAVLLYLTNLGAAPPVMGQDAAVAEGGPSAQEKRAEMIRQAQLRKAQKDAGG